MNVNGYEIKPFTNLAGADLRDAKLDGANLEGTILEKKEEPQDDKDLRIQKLEEELKKYKDTLKDLIEYNHRCEWFYGDCEVEDEKTRKDLMIKWLHSAYLSGYNVGRCSND